MNHNVHDNEIVPPCIWKIWQFNLNYDVMKKYPNVKKVDGKFGLLKNKDWFLNLGPFDTWNLMS